MQEGILQMGMPNKVPERRLRLTGEDVHEGLREWVKADLKESPRQGYDLGKFFFSVSVGTVGALAAIDKLNQTTRIDAPLLFSLGILFASIIVSLILALPRTSSIGGDSDMHARSEEHTSELQSRLHLVCRLLLEKKKKN